MSDDDLDFFIDCYERANPRAPAALPPTVEAGDAEDFIHEPEPVLPIDTGEEQVVAILHAVPSANRAVVEKLVGQSTKAFVSALLNPALSKRACCVRDLLLTQGWVTYAQIKPLYDCYRRAKRDLIDVGLTLQAKTIHDGHGRTTLFEFDPQAFAGQQESRLPLSAKDREELKRRFDYKCNLCSTPEHHRHLEADHRIGFDLVGNDLHKAEGLDAFQPLCAPCNDKRQRACMECPNKDPDTCRSCRWAYPEKYAHVATRPERRAELVIHHPKLAQAFDELWPRIQTIATQRGETPGEVILRVVLQARNTTVSAPKMTGGTKSNPHAKQPERR
jgi:hypothetical protein